MLTCVTLMKKYVLVFAFQICKQQQDELSESVRVRLQSAASDLHAADARYQVLCYVSFTSTRNVESASKSRPCSVVSNKDDALEEVISAIRLNLEKIYRGVLLKFTLCTLQWEKLNLIDTDSYLD